MLIAVNDSHPSMRLFMSHMFTIVNEKKKRKVIWHNKNNWKKKYYTIGFLVRDAGEWKIPFLIPYADFSFAKWFFVSLLFNRKFPIQMFCNLNPLCVIHHNIWFLLTRPHPFDLLFDWTESFFFSACSESLGSRSRIIF